MKSKAQNSPHVKTKPVYMHRAEQHNKFVKIENSLAQNGNLSYRARGFLVEALSRPEDWVFYVNHAARTGKDCRNVVLGILKELRKEGYAHQTKSRTKDGKFEYRWHFFEIPPENTESFFTATVEKDTTNNKPPDKRRRADLNTGTFASKSTLGSESKSRDPSNDVTVLDAEAIAANYKLDVGCVQQAIDWFEKGNWRKKNKLTGEMETVQPRYREMMVVKIARRIQKSIPVRKPKRKNPFGHLNYAE